MIIWTLWKCCNASKQHDEVNKYGNEGNKICHWKECKKGSFSEYCQIYNINAKKINNTI